MTAWIIPTAAAVVLQLWLNVYTISRPPTRPIRGALHAMLFAALLFTVGDLLASFVMANETGRWVGLAILYTGLIFVTPTWWLLALRYCEAQELGVSFTRSKWTYLPLLTAGLLWVGMITNPLHHQFITPQESGASIYHWMWWWNALQSYLLLIGVSALYAGLLFQQKSRAIQNQLLILLSATLSTAVASAVYVFAPLHMPFDPTSIGVCVSSVLFLYGIHGTQLFSLSPFALTKVMEHQREGILIAHPGGRLLYANEAAAHLMGYAVLPVDIQVFEDLARALRLPDQPEKRMDESQVREMLISSETPEQGHLFRFGKDRQGWLRIDATPIRGWRGTIRGWSLSLSDQTSLKKASDAVQAGEIAVLRARNLESLGVMAGGVAHDFNNLLQGILGNTELAMEHAENKNPALREYLGDIEAAAERARILVSQLLLFSGGAMTQKDEVALGEIVLGVANFVSESIPETIKVKTESDPDLPRISADPGQIGQAIVNLIMNASEAIGDRKGTIKIRIANQRVTHENLRSLDLVEPIAPGRYIKLETSDDGEGMTQEVRSRIFEPFYSTRFPGRGLGLSAILGIVRGHAGGISIRSDLGVGSRVSVYLPIEAGSAPALGRPPRVVDPNKAVRVLVVDDQSSVRSVCARALKRAGAEVTEAASGAFAIDFATDRNFDAAIVDLTMPGLNGIETARQLRSLDPELRIILSSGHGDSLLRDKIDPDLICGYLHKPYRPSEMVGLLNELLEYRLETRHAARA